MDYPHPLEELKADGKTVLFYLVGKKGRAVLRREFPKDIAAMFDTSEVREPGFTGGTPVARDQTILQALGEAFRYPSFQMLMAG